MYRKMLQTLPPKNSLLKSTSRRPKAYICIKIKSPAQVLFSNFVKFVRTIFYRSTVSGCFWSLSGLMEKYILEINN